MVSETYLRLDAAKQQRILDALLQEFSAHSLATAQVARIVQAAGIARGAFYKYFDDLTDAYGYLFKQVMLEVHQDLPQERDYFKATQAFVLGAKQSRYQALLRQHYAHNQGLLAPSEPPVGPSPSAWAVKVLCHDTIRACLLDPDHAQARLKQLQAALTIIDQ